VLTAFLLANNGKLSEHDGDLLAVERLATYRLFLYCSPSILPSVTVEAGLIPEGVKLEEHLRFIAYTFWQVILDQHQKELVEQRAEELKQYHSGALDCRIVAEPKSERCQRSSRWTQS